MFAGLLDGKENQVLHHQCEIESSDYAFSYQQQDKAVAIDCSRQNTFTSSVYHMKCLAKTRRHCQNYPSS